MLCSGRFGVRGMEKGSENHDGVEAKPWSRQFRRPKAWLWLWRRGLIGGGGKKRTAIGCFLWRGSFLLAGLAKLLITRPQRLGQIPYFLAHSLSYHLTSSTEQTSHSSPSASARFCY